MASEIKVNKITGKGATGGSMDGKPNTGGGGGGHHGQSANPGLMVGGAGGSGIVVIRYAI